jgi:putative ATP-binding cassette transporter
MTTLFIYSQAVFYMLMALMVFVVPEFSPIHSRVIVKVSAAILFMLGPISSAVGAMPEFAKANAAAESILEMDALLSHAAAPTGEREMAPPASFSEIRMLGVHYQYRDASKATTFSAGPFDLAVKKGELVFISGGNGSGKSTFLKLLTALYQPERGSIQLDGVPVLPESRQRYRNLFAVIFADFHLFSRPFGLGEVDAERFAGLLDLMELRGVTNLVDGVFEPLDLSTGQRKRLALIVAMLEDRPIFVFDEWAADQDPVFRRKFYEELLARFKEQGKTVVAVTHDDKYYHVADRVLRMEEGRFVAVEGSNHAG